jgi:RimJ/RimL family protein N-acetyltransferase
MVGRRMMETERLWLREFDEGDVADFYALGSDPQVIRYTGADQLTSLEHALEVLRSRPIADYQQYGYGRWACILKTTGEFIGWAGLKYLKELPGVDMGYWLLPAHWGCGLATEAAAACVRYGFERLNLQCIIGLVDPANVASVRVLEKVGMNYIGPSDIYGGKFIRYEIRADSYQSARHD